MIAAGCGGTDAGNNAATAETKEGLIPPVLTSKRNKTEYVARSNELCAEYWGRMLESFRERYPRVARRFRNAPSLRPSEEKRFQSATRLIFLAGLQAIFDDVHYLGAPKGEEQRAEAMLTALQKSVYDGFERRIRTPRQFSELFHRFNVLAYRYGMNNCLVYESTFRE
jgi:hypothetical protein